MRATKAINHLCKAGAARGFLKLIWHKTSLFTLNNEGAFTADIK